MIIVTLPAILVAILFFNFKRIFMNFIANHDISRFQSILLTDQITVNLLRPHDALMHHLISLKKDLIFLQPRVLEQKIPWN